MEDGLRIEDSVTIKKVQIALNIEASIIEHICKTTNLDIETISSLFSESKAYEELFSLGGTEEVIEGLFRKEIEGIVNSRYTIHKHS